MTYPFTPVGNTALVTYADDSSDIRVSTVGANAIMVYNPDGANVIAVGTGLTSGEVDAVVPTSGFNGEGCIVAPGATVIIRIPQAQYAAGNIFVCVAGESATGSVFITPGAV